MAQTKQNELIIFQKNESLFDYAEDILIKFPRHEKTGLAMQIRNSMSDTTRWIVRANKVYCNMGIRVDMLNQLDAEIQLQKIFVRRAHKKRYISNKNYMEWSRRLDEIGRILGGWIKSTVGKNV